MDIVCEMNPQKTNVRVENGVKIMYLRLLKALYGYMESPLLWYDLYSENLKSQGLLINEYYRCISNSTIKDNHCTIACYVDDNKVSHVNEEVNTNEIETISKTFVNFTVSRGKKKSSW